MPLILWVSQLVLTVMLTMNLSLFCFFTYIFHNTEKHPAVFHFCCFFLSFLCLFFCFVLFYIHSFDLMYLQQNCMKSKNQCYCTSPARGLAEQYVVCRNLRYEQCLVLSFFGIASSIM